MSTSASATLEAPVQPEATAEPAGDEAPPESVEASQPGEAEAGSQSEVEQPSGDDPPAAEPKDPATTAESPKQDHRPFAFSVDRTRREVPGAIETNDGWIAMPKEAWQKHVQPALRDPDALKRERAEMQRQLAERDPERSEVFQRAKLLTEEIDRIVGSPNPEEQLVEWAIGLINNMPVLKERALRTAAEAKLSTHTQRETAEQRQTAVRENYQLMQDALQNEVKGLLESQEFTGLGLNQAELVELLWEIAPAVFFEAPEDSPEDGIRKGEILYKKPVIHRLVKQQADLIRRSRGAATAASAARAANDAKLNPGKAPPAVTSKGSATPAGKKTAINSREEWEASLRS